MQKKKKPDGTPDGIPGVGPEGEIAKCERSTEKTRPLYGIENHEDAPYHDKATSNPDCFAFLQQAWVFNRSMQWLRPDDGTILCWSKGGDLELTGLRQVSAWFAPPESQVENEDDWTLFKRRPVEPRRNCLVLPSFQFHVEQHPVIEVEAAEPEGEWQFCAMIKGRSGPPFLSTAWRSDAAKVQLDIQEALKARGCDLHYAEVHFAMCLWAEPDGQPASVRFRARILCRPAVVCCLPVVRTEDDSLRNGIPISAIVVNAGGQMLDAKQVDVTAAIGRERMALVEKDGVWQGRLQNLAVGEHEVELTACGSESAKTKLLVRVTDGRFYGYSADSKSLTLGANATGPLSGSFQGMAFFRDVGLPGERMVQGQEEWDQWDRSAPPGEHWHYWEALTEAELDARFAHLAACGWNLLHICQHWGIWERLDAGGRIAPHGAQQLALYLRVAARHDLAVLLALSHYPYDHTGEKYTVPFSRYVEAGYQLSDWADVASSFTEMFHSYIADVLRLFRSETAIFAMTTSGEGDVAAGPSRVNDTYDFVRRSDTCHLFLSEPIHRMTRLPGQHTEGWKPKPYGSRMYWIGEEIEPANDLAIEFKLLQLGHYFMAEGSWPCPPLYAKSRGFNETWAGTERYRRRVRDSLYIVLMHHCPIMLTWDEQHSEDERIVLDEVRRIVQWDQPFRPAPVAIRIASDNVGDYGSEGGKGRAVLGRYEDFLAELAVMSRYLLPDQNAEDALFVYDAREPYREPAIDAVAAGTPIRVSIGYCASYLWAEDGCTFLAYLYNTTRHIRIEGMKDLSGCLYRLPGDAPLHMAVTGLPQKKLACRLYDLDKKTLIENRTVMAGTQFSLEASSSDYLLAITPAK